MKIEDYLHLYLPYKLKCQSMGYNENIYEMTGISYDETQNIWWVYFDNEEIGYAVLSDVFPILRPLSSIWEKEKNEIGFEAYSIMRKSNQLPAFQESKVWAAKQTLYLLSRHFDLFNLIENGLALDATKLSIPNN